MLFPTIFPSLYASTYYAPPHARVMSFSQLSAPGVTCRIRGGTCFRLFVNNYTDYYFIFRFLIFVHNVVLLLPTYYHYYYGSTRALAMARA